MIWLYESAFYLSFLPYRYIALILMCWHNSEKYMGNLRMRSHIWLLYSWTEVKGMYGKYTVAAAYS